MHSFKSWWAQAFHNPIIALVLAMIVIIPLVAAPANNIMRSVAALTYEGAALLLVTILIWRADWDVSRESVAKFLRTAANLPVLMFIGLAFVSCVRSQYKAFAIQTTLQLGAGVLLYFVVAYQFRQSKHLSMLADTLLFLASMTSVLTMGQYAFNSDARGTAIFGNQQLLGSLLMILLPIIAAMALTDKSRSRQLVAQVVALATAGSLMLALTRSAWLGAAAGLMVLAGLAVAAAFRERKSFRSHAAKTQKHKVVLPLVLVLASISFVFLIVTQNGGVVDRMATLNDVSIDKSWNSRQDSWNGAMAMIKAHPLSGVGIGKFPVIQALYTGKGQFLGIGNAPISLAEQAHNFYLQTGAELGLPGLALILWVVISFLIAALKQVRQMDAGIRRTLLMGSIGSIVAFSIDAFSSPSWQFGQVSMFFWLMMGIGVCCLRPRVKQEEKNYG